MEAKGELVSNHVVKFQGSKGVCSVVQVDMVIIAVDVVEPDSDSRREVFRMRTCWWVKFPIFEEAMLWL